MRRTEGTWAGALTLAGLSAALLLCSPTPATAQAIDTTLWATNGRVNAVVRSGNTVYLGGEFTRVGPAVGSGVPIDAATGLPVTGSPKVVGDILAVASDGAGGWYLGGIFHSVGGVTRNYLAHVLSDMSVAAWDPDPDGPVYALLVSGATVYAGGSFTTIGGQARSRVAALDAGTSVATAWDPGADNTVLALARGGPRQWHEQVLPTIYLGGFFTTVGGQARNHIAAVDSATGLANPWNPDANDAVLALAVFDTLIYAGWNFTTMGGASRNYVAAAGEAVGFVLPWNPNANASVRALAADGVGKIFAGGDFTSFGGQARNGLAAVDYFTGLATAWNPDPVSLGVEALAVSGSTVYVSGFFSTIGGQTRSHLAAVDKTTGLATAWDPGVGDRVFALATDGTTVYAGGRVTTLGGVARNFIAALDATTGLATSWDPNANGSVSALALRGAAVYAAGMFTTIGGQARGHLAAIDPSTGSATAWDPNANGWVAALAVSDDVVYVGGQFTWVGGQPRTNFAALSPLTGASMLVTPTVNDRVLALARRGMTVYLGGRFSSVDGQGRAHLAAVDAVTGMVRSWGPSTDGDVLALAAPNDTLVYVGGSFTMIGGELRNNIAAVDAASGWVTAWNPNANGTVEALAAEPRPVYAGGQFTWVGGQPRVGLACLSIVTGNATGWNPSPSPGVAVGALTVSGATVYAGGTFTTFAGRPLANIAAMSAQPVILQVTPSSGGNAGPVTLTISGYGFSPSDIVKLVRLGWPEILGTGVTAAPDGRSLTATFDLTGTIPNFQWNLTVMGPGGASVTRANAFTTTVLDAPALTVSMVGYSLVSGMPVIRKNRRTAFDLVIENKGNVDAQAVPLWLAGIPGEATVELDFALAYPPRAVGEPDWSTVPLSFTSPAGRYLTLVIPRVPPGTTTRRVYLTVPDPYTSITLTAALTPPWEGGQVFQRCLTGGGVSDPACMAAQLAAIDAWMAGSPPPAAVSGIAIWSKEAWQCEGGIGLGDALTRAEAALDYLGIPVEQGTAPEGCGDVMLPRWREVVTIGVVGSLDPNDKLGVAGTLSGQQSLPYSIRFENLSSATAPAQQVWVDDMLDPTKLDLTTVSLDAITFGNVRLSPPPGQTSYATTVDLRPGRNLLVDVAVSLDPLTHRLTWYFNSVDPATGGPPPLDQGFLPPNVTPPQGEGSVLFTVRPLPGLSSGATVSNAAAITFDDPPAVGTPVWQNTVDNTPPASRVKPFTTPQDPGRFRVEWEAVGSWPDMRDYTVYVSEDGGAYRAWRMNSVSCADTFAAQAGHSYAFYSRARDLSGNVETAPGSPDATLSSPVGVGEGGPPRLSLAGPRPNPARDELRVWFTLESDAPAWLELYDVAGRRVARRAVGSLGAGEHALTLGGPGALRAGLYFLRLSQGRRVLHARVAVVR